MPHFEFIVVNGPPRRRPSRCFWRGFGAPARERHRGRYAGGDGSHPARRRSV